MARTVFFSNLGSHPILGAAIFVDLIVDVCQMDGDVEVDDLQQKVVRIHEIPGLDIEVGNLVLVEKR